MSVFLEVQEVADIIDVDEVSAVELLNGTIEFEVQELYDLACRKGVMFSRLCEMLEL